ncbi:MAG: hypothetical protein VB131_06620 [Burkholderia gladioli]
MLRELGVGERRAQHVDQDVRAIMEIGILELEFVAAAIAEVAQVGLDAGHHGHLVVRFQGSADVGGGRRGHDLHRPRPRRDERGELAHPVCRRDRFHGVDTADRGDLEPGRRLGQPAPDQGAQQAVGQADRRFEHDHHAPASEQLGLEACISGVDLVGRHRTVIDGVVFVVDRIEEATEPCRVRVRAQAQERTDEAGAGAQAQPAIAQPRFDRVGPHAFDEFGLVDRLGHAHLDSSILRPRFWNGASEASLYQCSRL